MAPATKLIARLAQIFVMSSRRESIIDPSTYTANAVDGIEALQTWYREDLDGLYDSTGWWNSANCIQVLADFSQIRPDEANELQLGNVLKNTFDRAQSSSSPIVLKTFDTFGLVHAQYLDGVAALDHLAPRAGFPGFINDYYDDEGWWALALIRSHDVTGQQYFLDTAVSIFDDMQTGGNTPCGGIYWSKVTPYVNAITNQLYLSVAASLANRHPDGDTYRQIAIDQWEWLKNSGMINENNTFNDGLTEDCRNNGMQVWSYNQGVVLGGLVELAEATEDPSYLQEAHKIAVSAMKVLGSTGILREESCEPECGGDGSQFKGIFMRNLRYLHEKSPMNIYRDFIFTNADSIWNSSRDSNNRFGLLWAGPPERVNASTHSSALDAIVAAVGVA